MSYVHGTALSMGTFVVLHRKRIEQNLSRAINRRQGIVRTKMIVSLTCIFAFTEFLVLLIPITNTYRDE